MPRRRGARGFRQTSARRGWGDWDDGVIRLLEETGWREQKQLCSADSGPLRKRAWPLPHEPSEVDQWRWEVAGWKKGHFPAPQPGSDKVRRADSRMWLPSRLLRLRGDRRVRA